MCERVRLLGGQCYNFTDIGLTNSGGAPLPAGSRVVVDVFDNVLPNGVLDVSRISSSLELSPADAAASKIWFRHNTIVGDLSNGDYGISGSGSSSLPIVAANNVFVDIRQPLNGTIKPSANIQGASASGAADWFQGYSTGDYRPNSQGSPLIGVGDKTYGASSDYDGWSRSGSYDVGAYQHH